MNCNKNTNNYYPMRLNPNSRSLVFVKVEKLNESQDKILEFKVTLNESE